jgi:hypothetical protein
LIQAGTTLTAVGGQHAVPSVLVFPRAPLEALTAYNMRVTTYCGRLGIQKHEWQFVTRAAVEPRLTEVWASRADADRWQNVAIRLRDATSRPIAGAVLVTWEADQPISPDAAAMEFREVHNVTGGDGLLLFDVRLPLALDEVGLQLAVDTDGRRVPFTLHLTTAGNATSMAR